MIWFDKYLIRSMAVKLYLGNLSVKHKMRILLLNFCKSYIIHGLDVWVLSTSFGGFGNAGCEFNEVLVEAFSFVFVVFWFRNITEINVGHLLLNGSNDDNEILLIYCKKLLFFMNFFQFMLLIANGCTLLKCAEQSSNYISSVLFTIFEHCYWRERKIIIVCIALFMIHH